MSAIYVGMDGVPIFRVEFKNLRTANVACHYNCRAYVMSLQCHVACQIQEITVSPCRLDRVVYLFSKSALHQMCLPSPTSRLLYDRPD